MKQPQLMIITDKTSPKAHRQIAVVYYHKRNLSAYTYKLLYRRTLNRLAREHRNQYLEAFKEVNPALVEMAFIQPLKMKALIPDIPLDELIKRAVQLLTPIYFANVSGSGKDALLLAGLSSVDFVPNTPAIRTFMSARTLATSTLFTMGTDARVRHSLIRGINQGESIRNLEHRITGVFRKAEGYRAERIARSESIRATNFASVESWQQSGVVSAKEWSAILDDRTHEDCIELHGKRFNLGDTILPKGQAVQENGRAYDYEDIQHPPLFPNCRCTLLPVQA